MFDELKNKIDELLGLKGGVDPTTEPSTLTIKDVVAPSYIEEEQNHLKFGEKFCRSFFVFSYPHYLTSGWLSPIVNLDAQLDISFFIHPVDTAETLKKLRKKLTEVQAQMSENQEKGLVRDPVLETAYKDLEELRDRLQSAQERMFKFGLYITIYGDDEEELSDIENNLRSILEAKVVYIKPALFQQKEGFISTSPYGLDKLDTHTRMNTQPLSSIFPFISSDLSSNEGILYGINMHNRSLVLFDRFSLENPNQVVFGTSGSGKSYLVKLQTIRSLMAGTDVIILDPENEYKTLAEEVGGKFYNISIGSDSHINPLDIPPPEEGERPGDAIRTNVINLVGLLRIMLGDLTNEEDAMIDQALRETYAAKDITPDSDPSTWEEKVPLLSDLEQVLESMEGTRSLLVRLRRFTRGAYSEFFNQYSNVSTDNNLTVFGIRDLEDDLRPMAMFIIMRFIWKIITGSQKRRVLVVDEAWWMMQNEDGASFLFGLVKRSRKYGMGVTTITQDVADFMKSEYGQPIITNSALRFLLKQSPAVIDMVQDTFNLTDQEKHVLLEGEVGEGIFFAGKKHVSIKILASYAEDQIITSTPEEIQKIKDQKKRERESQF
ncbi:MAG: VirB4-like conjugal transfer ATPase, CD1110 family [Patescibacteria group bacterium]